MLKITTRIFTAGAMAGMLIGLNSGAFACEGCAGGMSQTAASKKSTTTKMASKTTKTAAKAAPKAKVAASVKIAPKVVKKSAVKATATQANATQASAKTVAQPCPHCAPAMAAKSVKS